MYAQYKTQFSANHIQHQTTLSTDKTTGDEQLMSDDEVEKTVARCWDEIDRQMKLHGEHHDEFITYDNPAPGGWRSVRLFVSSTFTDFFSEREILVKKVFPELREWCSERRLKLIEVDLRWGIPADATTEETIATCMEELDNCHQTSEGEPFFLNLLGERYGWIPKKSEVPSDVWTKYNWIDGTSITFMEIMQGALKGNPLLPHRLLFPISSRGSFPQTRQLIPWLLDAIHMILKSKIKENFPANTFEYAPIFDGVVTTTGRDMVKIIDFDDFAYKCLDFFKHTIQSKYPDQQNISNFSQADQEKELQRIFVKEKSDLVIGRDDELKVLMNYVTSNDTSKFEKIDPEGAESTKRDQGQLWKRSEDDNLVCVVEAHSGCGKTSFLSRFVVEATAKKHDLFLHFCGSTARSYNEHELLKSMIKFLLNGITVSNEEMNLLDGSNEEQISLLNKVLVKFRQSERSALIVVDGVNELNTQRDIDHLCWLPPSIPKNLHIVVSCNEHKMSQEGLQERSAYWFHLAPLNQDSLRKIAVTYLGNFNKKLDDQQMASVMSKVDGPLSMTMMCEELRVFGDFRMINRKIEDIPNSLDGLFGVILQRLQQEDNTGCIKKALCSLASSEAGILSADILKILGDIKNMEPAPALYWAQAKRHLKPYIRMMGFPEEYITFVHLSVWKAVKKILLSTQEENITWQRHIADYYQYGCDKPHLRIFYLPLHLKKAEEHNRLAKFLQTDGESMRIPIFKRSRYFDDLRCPRPSNIEIPMTMDVQICQVCKRKVRMFNPNNLYPAEKSCIICAANCLAFPQISNARICGFHSSKLRNKCFLCSMILINNPDVVPGRLCNDCSFGLKKNKCCIIGSN